MKLSKKCALVLRLVDEQCAASPVEYFYVHDFHYQLKDGTDIYLGMGNSGDFLWTYAKRSFEALVNRGLIEQPNKDVDRLFKMTLAGVRHLHLKTCERT